MLLALAVALSACGPDPAGARDSGQGTTPTEEPSALVTDLDGSVWFYGDPATGRIGTAFDLVQAHPDECSEPWWCMLYQARQRVAADGATEVVYTYSPVDGSDGDLLDREDRLGRIVSVDAQTLAPRWRLDALDFSQLPGGDAICPADPDDPCRPAADTSDRDFHRCQLYQPHDLWVSAEDADGLMLWIADTRNARMLQVAVDRDRTCGRVQQVLDADHPDWDIYNSVNSFELREGAAGPELLMSIKDTFALSGGGAQLPGDGRGKILLWRQPAGGEWQQVWEHPPAVEGAESFVNAPHGVSWWEQDGQLLVAYAHSLGQGRGWNTGEGASVGVLRVENDQPVYLFDADIEGDALMYSRDTTPLPDGRLMITDTGCKGGGDCEFPTGIWLAPLPELPEPDGRTGAWTPDGSDQRFLSMQAEGPRRFGGRIGLYSAEWVGAPPAGD